MIVKYLNFIYILMLPLNQILAQHSMIIKNVKCLAVDKSFCRFDECGFRTLENGQDIFNIALRLLKVPVTNCILGIEFRMKALNLPVTFNATYNACEFMESRKKNRVLMRFYEAFAHFMNVNHSCPYNHDIFFRSSKEFPVTIPVPWSGGEYTFKTNWIMDKKIRLKVDGAILFAKSNQTKRKYNQN